MGHYRWKWAPHREECRRLYVDEGKTLEEVMDVMREYGFTPSRRQFQHMFWHWKFPMKTQVYAKNEAVTSRVQELWRQGMNTQEIIQALGQEGVRMTKSQLDRIRRQRGWVFKITEGYLDEHRQRENAHQRGARNDTDGDEGEADAEYEAGEEDDGGGNDGDDDDEDEEDENGSGQGDDGSGEGDGLIDGQQLQLGQGDAQAQQQLRLREIEAERENRKRELEVRAQELWQTKKRRRWTAPRHGLPADPPGPPRYPSEITISEARAVLELDAPLYTAMREAFQRICREEGVVKKTVSGPERWEAAKTRLVRETPHLRSVMWDQDDMMRKRQAVDTICRNAARSINHEPSRMPIAEVRRVLRLSPMDTSAARYDLLRLMRADHFAGVQLSGEAVWARLKERWLAESVIMQRILAEHGQDPASRDPRVSRAIFKLAKDSLKRYMAERSGPYPRKAQRLRKGETRGTKPAEEAIVFEDDGSDAPSPLQALDDRLAHAPDEDSQLMEAIAPLARDIDGDNIEAIGHSAARLLPPGFDGFGSFQVGPQPSSGPVMHVSGGDGEAVTCNGLTSGGELPIIFQEPLRPPTPPPKRPRGRPPKQLVPPPQAQAQQPPQPLQPRQAALWQAQPPQPPQTRLAAPQKSQPQRPQQQPPAPRPTGPAKPFVAYVRMHPASQVVTVLPATLIAIVPRPTVEAVQNAALAKLVQLQPGTTCVAIEGVIKDGQGSELPLPVTDDAELEAYLAHLQSIGVAAPLFCVRLASGC